VASRLIELPVGSIKPGGWLLEYLKRQKNGLTGNLGKISVWLQKDGNAWLSEDGKGQWGWEELPYWLKGYSEIAYMLEDKKMIDESLVWIEGALNSRRADGDFGPDHRMDDGSRDYWANMIMLFCLQSYYEYSGDQRVIDLMTEYFKYQLTVPDEKMLTGYWQRMRGGDNIYSIYWLYNRTGDEWLLDLATKMDRNTADWRKKNDLPNWHNVNIAQAFGEPATYYLQSHKIEDLQFAYDNFFEVRKRFGQVPGGMFGGDENCREGYDDPHQCVETCGLVEQMLSDETLMRITADPFWMDNCEDVAFNTYPAAVMPDFRSLRYLTGPNMVVSDQKNHRPGIDNGGPFLMMNPFSSRCCQHNHSHGWPYYARNLWMATPDNGVCAALYCENTAKVKVGEGGEVTLTENTHYPFDENISITVSTEAPVSFPMYLRVPGWCDNAIVTVNGKEYPLAAELEQFIKIERRWADGDNVELVLPMEVSLRTWEKNHGSVSVDYGPLTFSLKIEEQLIRFDSTKTAVWDSKWQKDADPSQWPSFEIHPATAWNYGLVLDEQDPASSFTVIKKDWPADDFPYTLESAPIEMQVKAKKIPGWALDKHGLCGELQDSPIASDEPVETVTLVPMGAARLRISSFPVIGEGAGANKWVAAEPVPEPEKYQVWVSHEYDDKYAACDNIQPLSSDDHNIPRFTWWDHRGTTEWIQYDFLEPCEIFKSAVYWFDDRDSGGECRVPKSWKLQYKSGDDWVDATGSTGYGVERDKLNEASFDSFTVDSVRIVVELQEGYSAGILEWTIGK
jgi:hypothetical protein